MHPEEAAPEKGGQETYDDQIELSGAPGGGAERPSLLDMRELEQDDQAGVGGEWPGWLAWGSRQGGLVVEVWGRGGCVSFFSASYPLTLR